jgi:hypothetical protein
MPRRRAAPDPPPGDEIDRRGRSGTTFNARIEFVRPPTLPIITADFPLPQTMVISHALGGSFVSLSGSMFVALWLSGCLPKRVFERFAL